MTFSYSQIESVNSVWTTVPKLYPLMFNSQVYYNFTWDPLLTHTWKKRKQSESVLELYGCFEANI